MEKQKKQKKIEMLKKKIKLLEKAKGKSVIVDGDKLVTAY